MEQIEQYGIFESRERADGNITGIFSCEETRIRVKAFAVNEGEVMVRFRPGMGVPYPGRREDFEGGKLFVHSGGGGKPWTGIRSRIWLSLCGRDGISALWNDLLCLDLSAGGNPETDIGEPGGQPL